MGLISRQGTAPIESGDLADAAEIEAEFDTLFSEINGNLNDANIVSGANISGTKLADNTVTNAKLADSTITTAKIASETILQGDLAQTALSRIFFVTDNTSYNITEGAYEDVDGLTATATSIAASDWVCVDAVMHINNSGTAQSLMTVSIDGTDQTDAAAVMTIGASARQVYSWTFQATATSHVLVMRINGSTLNNVSAAPLIRHMRVTILPQ